MKVSKRELQHRLKECQSINVLIMALLTIALATVFIQALIIMQISPSATDADPELEYGFATPANELIDPSSIDPGCIIRIDDFGLTGGKMWYHIKPECVGLTEVVYHTKDD